MFKKFIEGNPLYNGQPYEYHVYGWFSFLFFRWGLLTVNETFYHGICKDNPKNRASKMSFFAHMKDVRHELKYYINEEATRLYIVHSRTRTVISLLYDKS